ncbi:hypothetical protein AB1Y20_018544 [Prymnesium parvum]|uniref:Uncharacterized protein n=1 Tax=Prymnesium parvum TaxID=97485 RepID=A0AB34JNY1_PRYPA
MASFRLAGRLGRSSLSSHLRAPARLPSTPPPLGVAVRHLPSTLLGKLLSDDPSQCRFDRLGGEASVEHKLPTTPWLPTEEFPALARRETSADEWEAARRLGRSLSASVAKPEGVFVLGMSVVAIYMIASAEACFVVADELWRTQPAVAVGFCARYALEQTLVSAVWGTQQAQLIAMAMGLEPESVLRRAVLAGGARDSAEASALLWLYFLWASRSLIATSMFLSQVLRIVSLAMRAADNFKESVRRGKEPMFPGTEQRVIRLCGLRSDVTEVSLVRYGAHIVPVFEQPDAVEALMRVHSKNFRVPTFWHVPKGGYSFARSWAAFTFTPEFFLATPTGRRMLYIESDLTNSESHLSPALQSTDLTMEDASQAFLLIRRSARLWRKANPHVKKFRTFRVVLGNPRQLSASRGRTLRERFDTFQEADVLVDSQAPVIGEVLRWCSQVFPAARAGTARGDGLPANTIAVETDSQERYDALQSALLPFGFAVMDAAEAEALEQRCFERRAKGAAPLKEIERLPRLVHCTTTAQTISSLQALVKPRLGRRGLVNPSRCCALLDRAESVEALEDAHDEGHNRHAELHAELSESLHEAATKEAHQPSRVHIICTAVLYDDLLRQVRVWARLGHSAQEIQSELDSRFARVAGILEDMAEKLQ